VGNFSKLRCLRPSVVSRQLNCKLQTSNRAPSYDIRHSAVLFLKVFCCLILLFLFSPMAYGAEQTCKDSIIAVNPNSNFTIHKDGTVSHNTTGLMWMRCSLGQKWDGKTCAGSPTMYTWKEALQAGAHYEFAGYADWRLPNKNELESIVEERCYSPAVNSTVFLNTPPVFFWSSSPYAGFSQGAWSVDFGFGAVNASDKDGGIAVRLVRDDQL
jgi:hypothetical protein